MSAKSSATLHEHAQEGPAEADLNAWEVYTRLRVIFYELELDGVSHLNDEILDMVVKKASAICRKDNESELLRVMSAIEKRKGDNTLYALLKKYLVSTLDSREREMMESLLKQMCQFVLEKEDGDRSPDCHGTTALNQQAKHTNIGP